MRILVVTPLFPPEIAEPAPYVKELVARLAAQHEVTLLAYTHLPEQVAGVRVCKVEKHKILPLRLMRLCGALIREMRTTDVVYAINGMSIELPLRIASLLVQRPIVYAVADHVAAHRAQRELVPRLLAQWARRRAAALVEAFPPPRPEILPLEPYPSTAFHAYDASWTEHLALLDELFVHAH